MQEALQNAAGTPQSLSGQDVPFDGLVGRTVALLGYGNQGRAHALNLRDSGATLRIGGRPGSNGTRAAANDGFAVGDLAEVARGADLVIVALPDEHHARVWREHLGPVVQPGQTLGFLHGLSVHFGLVSIPAGVGCVLVAPKGPGTTLRDRFVQGQGIPALLAVHQDTREPGRARALALAWAAGIGSGRAGVIPTTFRDEAVTDLFGEQAVLCGGMLSLARTAFETLVARGYPPLLAYIECVHEIKQVADLLYERGPAGMCRAISNTAEFGAHEAARALADDALRARMARLLDGIESGEFAARLARDAANGGAVLAAERERLAGHAWEAAGREARALMPWLGNADRGGA
jgi:ketol-acid reductoisomerase